MTQGSRASAGNGGDEGSAIAAAAFANVVGSSAALRDTIALGCRVAAYGPNVVLIQGETGTGKELFARGIHASGPHPGDPFVPINCAAIPESLLESELFGHERGAFSGAGEQKRGLLEVAGRGTVFLDEIGELPIQLQPKLLRVLESRTIRRVGGLQEHRIDCRIVAATNRDLSEASTLGMFRPDLYYRLSTVAIQLPPLRDRAEDIEVLAHHFVEQITREHGRQPKRLAPETLTVLHSYSWPGNVRELRNAIEGAMIASDDPLIRPEHVLVRRRATVAVPLAPPGIDASRAILIPPAGLSLAEAERQLIAATLRLVNNNQSEAARILEISRPRLARKIRQYGLPIRNAAATSD